MFLDATTKSLELILDSAVTTNAIPVTVDYVDMTTTTTLAGSIDSQSSGVTAVTILAAPAASTQRKVNGITVYNADTAAKVVTLRLNNNSVLRPLVVATLQIGDTLGYTDVNGFYVQDTNGNRKTSAITFSAITPLMDGVAAVGIAQVAARGDHVHPSDTSRESIANKNVANGYAPLDAGAKVPIANLPAAVAGAMSYQGTWNAATNTPALASGVGTKGYYYKVSVAGTTSLDGHAVWTVDDTAVFDGTTWDILQGGITSGEIITALGYTPENATATAQTIALSFALSTMRI